MSAVMDRDRQIEPTVSDSTIIRMDLLTGSVVKHLQEPMVVTSQGRNYSVWVDSTGTTTIVPMDGDSKR